MEWVNVTENDGQRGSAHTLAKGGSNLWKGLEARLSLEPASWLVAEEQTSSLVAPKEPGRSVD